MRGKQLLEIDNGYAGRITPADAGKTLYNDGMDGRRPDHPRGCGENTQSSDSEDNRPGSPPRMRGKRSCGAGFEYEI